MLNYIFRAGEGGRLLTEPVKNVTFHVPARSSLVGHLINKPKRHIPKNMKPDMKPEHHEVAFMRGGMIAEIMSEDYYATGDAVVVVLVYIFKGLDQMCV